MAQHQGLRGSVRDGVAVLADAAKLLVRRWPVLLSIALMGVAVRGAAHWGAVTASDHVGWLGLMLLTLVPLGYLLPVIAMLHLCGRDLPALQALRDRHPEDATSGRDRRLWHVMVSVLVPFLTVYVANNLLRADIKSFQNAAVADEFNKGFEVTRDFGNRVGIYPLQVVVMIVLVAVVVRFAVGKAEKRWPWLLIAAVGALVEIYYTSVVARLVDGTKADATGWLQDRQAVDWAQSNYAAAVDHLGWLAHPADTITGWVFGVLGSFDVLVIVPLAWLTVAAVVLGHKLAPEPPLDHPALDRLTMVPAPLRRGLGALGADLASRFTALLNGLRMLARAGLVPMLLFCLTYLIALRIPYLFALAVRRVVGPVDTTTWLAFAPIESAIGLALSMVMISVLLAAAIDRMVQPLLSPPTPSPSRTPASPTTSAPA